MPSNPEELLRRRRYWDLTFLRLFLEHVEGLIIRDPRAGLKFARVAPRLALLVPEGDQPNERRQHREAQVKAHAVFAAALRTIGRPDMADSEYELALKIADSAAISPSARAHLNHRLAVLRACQKRFVEALALVDEAVEIFRRERDSLGLAEALAKRGYVLNEAERFTEAIPHHGEALRLAGEALRLAGRRQRPAAAVRVHRAARVNLAHALTQSSADNASKAIDHIRAAFRELHGLRRCRERHHCQWIEGKAWLRFGFRRRAEQAFKVARRGFVRLDTPWEIALVSLDLAALYRSRSAWKSLEDLAADTFGRFRELCGDFEAIAALSLWVDATQARRGVKAAIGAARETIEARMERP